jgi:tetratricopeptide (TPR) repeat protein
MDGGVTGDGRQYIVMEYVDGVPIDQYAREKHLNAREVVGLFEKTCAAVAYAHENSVVHRDLKPGNLLVTADGTPKLLDFGISKLWEEEPVDGAGATLTEERSRALTPDYASPEQLVGGKATPASDVYSLGVLLYELLTGRRPYDIGSAPIGGLKQLGERGLESPRAIAKRMGGAGRISRDLDAIVLKALARDPATRYESAKELREDLERYLAQRPVAARPRAIVPRIGKFFVRRRWQLLASALVVISLSGYLVLERYQAKRTAERNPESVKSIRAMFTSLNDRVAQLPGSSDTRKFLISEVASRLERLQNDVGRDAELLYQVALCYYDLGQAWSSMHSDALLEPKLAQDALMRASMLARRAAGVSKSPRDEQLVARVLFARALAAVQDESFGDVIRFAEEGESFIASHSQALLRVERRETTVNRMVRLASFRGLALEAQNRADEAVAAWNTGERLLGMPEKLPRGSLYTAVMLDGNLARHFCSTGEPAIGLEYARRAETIAQEYMQTQSASINSAAGWVSEIAAECGLAAKQSVDAPHLAASIRDERLRFQQRDPQNLYFRTMTADSYELSGRALLKAGQFSGAERDYRKGLDVLSTALNSDQQRSSMGELLVAQIEYGLGQTYRQRASLQGSNSTLLRSACEYYSGAQQRFISFLKLHGGIPITGRRMMEDTGEELRTYCTKKH